MQTTLFTNPGHRLACGLVFLATLLLTGCSELAFYGQGVAGQWDMWQRQQPNDALIRNPDTDAGLRRQLQLAEEMKAFAVSGLALPDGGQFTSYADLQREAAVWVVIAAPPLSLKAKQWCYPVVGCQAYRGYFDRKDAKALASQLHQEGLETWIGGAVAYSTLGWFDDPLLNTFIRFPEANLAAVVFHELAHQVVYVDGDTTFNESFASVVEAEGVRLWFKQHPERGEEWLRWQRQRYWQEQWRREIEAARKDLEVIFSDTRADDAQKRQRRDERLSALQQQARQLGSQHPAVAPMLRPWTRSPINTAQLAGASHYLAQVPAFERLLQHSGNLPAFYQAVRVLAELPAKARREQLAQLNPGP